MERIAVVLGRMEMGGVENVVMDYYREIDHTRFQFDFFVDQRSKNIPQLEITKLGGRVFLLPPLNKVGKYKKALKHYLVEGGYNVMHVHLNTLSGWALKAGKWAKIPVRILHNHTTSSIKEGIRHFAKIFFRPFAKRNATHYAACSKHAGQWMFGTKAINDGRVTVFNNAIDLNRFSFDLEQRLEVRKQLGFEKDHLVVGNIGRLVKQKNQGFLIDVFAQCVKANDKLRLLIVGEGELKTKLVRKIEKYRLCDKVKIAECCSDIEKYYNAIDCLALPSIYEGLGRVAIEAQACGLKCICSLNVPREVEQGGEVSFIDLQNKSLWVETLLKSFVDVQQRIEKETVFSKEYDIKEVTKKLQEYYSEMSEDNGDSLCKSNRVLPLISVLVPVYNVKEYLKQVIDSVINQSYRNIEIMLVDDGSTDGSGVICDEYLVDERVRVFHKENEGLATTRNFLKDNAKGEYVVFVDGDDLVSPFYVENLYEALSSTGSDLACSGFYRYFEGDVMSVFNRKTNFKVVNKNEYLKMVLLQKMECSAWGKIYSRDLIGKITYPNGAIYEDVAVMPTILDNVDKVALVDSNDYVYRQNSQSILHKNFSQKDLDCVKYMEVLKDYISSNHYNLIKEMACRYFSAMSNVFLRINKKTHRQEYKMFWCKIKKARKTILKVKGARMKNKLGAILSYFGAFVFRMAYKLI